MLHLSDMMVMPILPMKMPKQLMRDDAEPVFSRCCSSIKFAPGVLTTLVQMVAGKITMVRIQG